MTSGAGARAAAALWCAAAFAAGCTHDYKDYFANAAASCPKGILVAERTIQKRQRAEQYACFVHGERPHETRVAPKAAGDVALSTAAENAAVLKVVYGGERKIIDDVKANDYSRYVGLALSGGGVRSGSFATGVMRGLYDVGLLSKVGYLSTVSGGGYGAAWMMSFHDVGRSTFESCDAAKSPDLDPDAAKARNEPVRLKLDALFRPGSSYRYHLTQHGEYLGYQHGHDSKSQLVLTFGKSVLAFPYNLLFNELLGYGINTGPFRRFYRDGVNGAFLFDYTSPGRDETVPLRPLPMSCFGPSAERPFWIINMALSLIDDHGAHHGRPSDAFELTPLWGGGTSVGYVETPTKTVTDRYREVAMEEPGRTGHLAWSPTVPRAPEGARDATAYAIDRDNFWMSPSYAVAISGAALDGHSLENGALGDALLNFWGAGIGYFVDGWSPHWWPDERWHLGALLDRGFFYFPKPLFYAFASAHKRSAGAARYLLLDGGVFDNVGLYALLRRGARFIVVADGTEDPPSNAVCKRGYDAGHPWQVDTTALGGAFANLRSTEVLLRTDLGVSINWQWDDLCTAFKPDRFLGKAHAFVMRGTIEHFPVDESGHRDTVRIVYVKAAYVAEGQSLRENSFIDATKTSDPEFANDSLLNQFFSETRVASYDELGYEQVGPDSEGLCRLACSWRDFCADAARPNADGSSPRAGDCAAMNFADASQCDCDAPGAPRLPSP
jgi:hypothetical protein